MNKTILPDLAAHNFLPMKSPFANPSNGLIAIARGLSAPLAPKPPAGRKNHAALSEPLAQQMPGIHHIELNLHDIDQLFNTMDPSPFHEKDLDHDAEEFILSWVQEFHRHDPVDLVVHLDKCSEGQDVKRIVEEGVHNYFAYRARLNQLEFKRLLKQGRVSLLVGLSFLLVCLALIELFALRKPGALPGFLSEGLTIAGWVAMWKPMEIYLYDWWPLRRRGQVFDKLSRMAVEVRKRG